MPKQYWYCPDHPEVRHAVQPASQTCSYIVLMRCLKCGARVRTWDFDGRLARHHGCDGELVNSIVCNRSLKLGEQPD